MDTFLVPRLILPSAVLAGMNVAYEMWIDLFNNPAGAAKDAVLVLSNIAATDTI
jgi:hypothetical protein